MRKRVTVQMTYCNECGSPAHSTQECLRRCQTIPRWETTRIELLREILHLHKPNPIRHVPLPKVTVNNTTRVRRKSEEEMARVLCVLGA